MVFLTNQSTNRRAPRQEARERRRWLSDSFNRGTQTLDEATVSARAMAASMERQGVLLRAPVRR